MNSKRSFSKPFQSSADRSTSPVKDFSALIIHMWAWHIFIHKWTTQTAVCGLVYVLTEHYEHGGSLLVSRRVRSILAGVASSIGHAQVFNPYGWDPQIVLEKNNSILKGHVGKTLPIGWVVHGNVVPLAINRFPYPRYLGEQSVLINTGTLMSKFKAAEWE